MLVGAVHSGRLRHELPHVLVLVVLHGKTYQRVQFSRLTQQVQAVIRLLLGNEVSISIVADNFLSRYLRGLIRGEHQRVALLCGVIQRV